MVINDEYLGYFFFEKKTLKIVIRFNYYLYRTQTKIEKKHYRYNYLMEFEQNILFLLVFQNIH